MEVLQAKNLRKIQNLDFLRFFNKKGAIAQSPIYFLVILRQPLSFSKKVYLFVNLNLPY